MRPRTDRLMLDGDIDDFLERNRPAHIPNRNTMIFMVEDRDDLEDVAIDQDHLYAIRPTSEVFIADHAWVNAIFNVIVREGDDGEAMTPELEAKCDEYAKGYWSGEFAFKKLGFREYRPALEYMTAGATVAKVFY